MKNLNLTVQLAAIDKITAPLKGVASQAKTVSEQIRGTKDAIKTLENQQGVIDNFKSLKRELTSNNTELDTAQRRAAQLASQLKNTANPTKALKQEFESAKKQAARLGEGNQQLQQRLQGARNALSQAGMSTKGLSAAESNLRNQLTQANKGLSDQHQRLQSLEKAQKRVTAEQQRYQKVMAARDKIQSSAMSATIAGGAMMAIGGAALAPAINFEADFSRVLALSGLDKNNSDDQEKINKLKKQAIDLGSTTSFTSGQVAQGQAYLAMAGFEVEDIEKSMQGVLYMTQAAGIDMARAADISSDILSGFGKDASEMGNVADILTKTFTSKNTSLELLGETMKYVGPIATKAGQSIETMAAMTGLLGDVGIKGSQAGTAMRAMINRLAGPTSKGAKALQELGIQTKDASGNLLPITDILADVAEKTKDLGNAEQLEYYKKIFGEEAATAAAELINKAGAGKIKEFAEELQQSAGTAQNVAKTMTDNLMGDIKQLESAREALGITLFEQEGSIVRSFVQSISKAVLAVNNWIKENPKLAGTLFKIFAVIAVTLTAVGALGLAVSALIGPFMMGIKVIKAIILVLNVLKIAMLTNPITLIITGIVLALVGLWYFWDDICSGMAKAWEWLGQKISSIWDGIIDGCKKIPQFFSNIWESITSFFNSGIGNITKTILDWSPLGLFYKAFSSVLGWFGIELPDSFSEFGLNIINGLTNGIKNSINNVKEAISEIADNTVGWFKNILGINSPSRVMALQGGFVSDGIAMGIAENDTPIESIKKLSNDITQTANGLAVTPASIGINPVEVPAINVKEDTRPPINARYSQGESLQQAAPMNVNIAINVSGGDAHAIAQAVRNELNNLEQQRQAKKRSSLWDQD